MYILSSWPLKAQGVRSSHNSPLTTSLQKTPVPLLTQSYDKFTSTVKFGEQKQKTSPLQDLTKSTRELAKAYKPILEDLRTQQLQYIADLNRANYYFRLTSHQKEHFSISNIEKAKTLAGKVIIDHHYDSWLDEYLFGGYEVPHNAIAQNTLLEPAPTLVIDYFNKLKEINTTAITAYRKWKEDLLIDEDFTKKVIKLNTSSNQVKRVKAQRINFIIHEIGNKAAFILPQIEYINRRTKDFQNTDLFTPVVLCFLYGYEEYYLNRLLELSRLCLNSISKPNQLSFDRIFTYLQEAYFRNGFSFTFDPAVLHLNSLNKKNPQNLFNGYACPLGTDNLLLIMSSLCDNAIKYGRDNTGVLTVHVHSAIQKSTDHPELVITLEDWGNGMSTTAIEACKQKALSNIQLGEPSQGFGLPSCIQLIQQAKGQQTKGDIDIVSKDSPEHGLKITIKLPLEKVQT